MAIRNAKLIENAANVMKNVNALKVEQTKLNLKECYNNILSHSQDIIDAIDTFNYCVQLGLDKKLKDFATITEIVFDFNRLSFQYTDDKNVYNWYIITDGKEVYIRVNTDISDVPTMINKTYYYNNKGYVIAPISDDKGYHATHNSDIPLSLLRKFNDKLPIFLDEFFKATENLA